MFSHRRWQIKALKRKSEAADKTYSCQLIKFDMPLNWKKYKSFYWTPKSNLTGHNQGPVTSSWYTCLQNSNKLSRGLCLQFSHISPAPGSCPFFLVSLQTCLAPQSCPLVALWTCSKFECLVSYFLFYYVYSLSYSSHLMFHLPLPPSVCFPSLFMCTPGFAESPDYSSPQHNRHIWCIIGSKSVVNGVCIIIIWMFWTRILVISTHCTFISYFSWSNTLNMSTNLNWMYMIRSNKWGWTHAPKQFSHSFS